MLDPLIKICDSLHQILEIDPNVIISSLRIGYLKSIHSLKLFVRGDHATVLGMWSNYLKHWDLDELHQAYLAGLAMINN
jgi:hypothetical protein